jgi:hypothetical protein
VGRAYVTPTIELLILACQLILELAGLVELGVGALKLLLFVAQVALTDLVEVDGLLEAGLQLDVGLLQLLHPLLQLPGCCIGLFRGVTKSLLGLFYAPLASLL